MQLRSSKQASKNKMLLLLLFFFFEIFYMLEVIHFGCIVVQRHYQGHLGGSILGRSPPILTMVWCYICVSYMDGFDICKMQYVAKCDYKIYGQDLC